MSRRPPVKLSAEVRCRWQIKSEAELPNFFCDKSCRASSNVVSINDESNGPYLRTI
ncbi:hypothetical protein DPMN_070782 [Dreissena polymorpha]|uniref:Uncharacterized protein n=1 Tax=Dreissena polymorpha TaxID=45954 RepID=A0A9D3Z1D2_DREPO|nr:hypothetical protein DPMN_070782 [Dreissena polymorpha]